MTKYIGDLELNIVSGQVDPPSILKNLSNSEVYDHALYIFNIDDVVYKYIQWKSTLPRIQPFYAVKCNSYEPLLKILAKLEVNFDCASKGEIEKILSLGISPDRIIYANPCKTQSFIKYAAQSKVMKMTFDSEQELYKIKQFHPNSNLILRIRSDAKKSRNSFGFKFGIEPENAINLLSVAKQLELNVIGVSFHVGSDCDDMMAYPEAIANAFSVFNVAKKIGYNFHLLDIGGGFPGSDDTSLHFKKLCHSINNALHLHFPQNSGVDIIAEPGRYFAASSFVLATTVIGFKKENDCHMYYINDGIYGSFNCILYDAQIVDPNILHPFKGDKSQKSCIWGPTCDSLDIVCKNVMLPHLEIGDWIYWKNMGAYTYAAVTSFNGFPKPRVLNFVSHDISSYLNNQSLTFPNACYTEVYSNESPKLLQPLKSSL